MYYMATCALAQYQEYLKDIRVCNSLISLMYVLVAIHSQSPLDYPAPLGVCTNDLLFALWCRQHGSNASLLLHTEKGPIPLLSAKWTASHKPSRKRKQLLGCLMSSLHGTPKIIRQTTQTKH